MRQHQITSRVGQFGGDQVHETFFIRKLMVKEVRKAGQFFEQLSGCGKFFCLFACLFFPTVEKRSLEPEEVSMCGTNP